jgi:hypothetical protein
MLGTVEQRFYLSIVPISVCHAVAGLMIHDLADAELFHPLDQWALILRDTSVVIHMVTNKTDLKTSLFIVSTVQGTGILDMFRQLAADLSTMSIQELR